MIYLLYKLRRYKIYTIPNRAIKLSFETNQKGCQLVTSHKPDKFGHIRMKIEGEQVFLHRFLYEKTYGKIEEGLVIRHKCDNPNCMNINHMEKGTHFDNVQDRVARGRSAKGKNNGRAKLTEDDVRKIKKDTIHTNPELAKMFNVDKSAIRSIRIGKTWKHII